MLKKRIIAVVAGLALLVVVTGSSGIVADALGSLAPSTAYACQSNGSAGGGC